jgi:hypothetical protein
MAIVRGMRGGLKAKMNFGKSPETCQLAVSSPGFEVTGETAQAPRSASKGTSIGQELPLRDWFLHL